MKLLQEWSLLSSKYVFQNVYFIFIEENVNQVVGKEEDI